MVFVIIMILSSQAVDLSGKVLSVPEVEFYVIQLKKFVMIELALDVFDAAS